LYTDYFCKALPVSFQKDTGGFALIGNRKGNLS